MSRLVLLGIFDSPETDGRLRFPARIAIAEGMPAPEEAAVIAAGIEVDR